MNEFRYVTAKSYEPLRIHAMAYARKCFCIGRATPIGAVIITLSSTCLLLLLRFVVVVVVVLVVVVVVVVVAPQPVHSRAAPGKACSIMSRIGTRYPVSMCCSLCKTRSSSRGSTKRVVLGVE